MRYRLVEKRRGEAWEPVTTIFESGDQVFIFARGRNAFPPLKGLTRLEDVGLEQVPLPDVSEGYRLSGIRDVEFEEQEVQRASREQGWGEIPDEFVEENHLALLGRRVTSSA